MMVCAYKIQDYTILRVGGWVVNTNRETERTKQDSVEMKLFSLSVGLNDLIFHEKNHDKTGRWSSNMIMSISCLETK